VQSREAATLAQAITALGIPVYLSGMARGLLGRDHPLQMRHQRRVALRESDCVLLAGVPCDFRLDYGKHVRRNATLIGTVEEVLVEGPDKTGKKFTGRTRGNRVCIFDANPRLIGQLMPLKIERASVSTLYGELVLSGVEA
jgi:hypothetical protein